MMQSPKGMGTEIGERFVAALAAKDAESLAAILDPNVAFRGLTPSEAWEGSNPGQVIDVLFNNWIEPGDHVHEVLGQETEQISDRTRLRYRLRVETDGVTYMVQQGYFDTADGRITRMSLMCSGFRTWPE